MEGKQMIKAGICLKRSHLDWVKSKCINLSAFVRKKIDDAINKNGGD